MNLNAREEKISYFQSKILTWFEKKGRNFPWRSPLCSDYEIIIAEVLLQRTNANNVNKLYSKFLSLYPDWHSLGKKDLISVEKFLQQLGLQKQRALRLSKLANYMCQNNSIIPKDREQLDKLPFMGQYIGNAVELLIFKRPRPLLDVNMSRVLERFFGPRILVDIRRDPYLQSLAYDIVQHPAMKAINWGILDLAAIICKARNPRCSECPINEKCLYNLTLDSPEVYPNFC